MPKLSIITVNLNNAEGLEKTIESVINQTFINYEYIIIDGFSTDSSVEIIKKYENKITNWISEKDSGIYNGMNKGILKANGEYCLFLNSGDWLINGNVLTQILSKIEKPDIIYCNIKTEIGNVEFPGNLTFDFLFHNAICHQSMIINTNLFNEIGLYNETFKIVSDWEFTCIAFLLNKKFIKVNSTLSYYDIKGVSSDINNTETMSIEREAVLRKLIPGMYDDYIELFNTKNQLEKCEIQLQYYNNSKLVQLVKRLQQSKIYKKIRKIK